MDYSLDNLRVCVSPDCNVESRLIQSLDDIDKHYMHKYLKFTAFQQEVLNVFKESKIDEIQYTLRQQAKIEGLLENIKNIKLKIDELEKQLIVTLERNLEHTNSQKDILALMDSIQSAEPTKLNKLTIDTMIDIHQNGLDKKITEWAQQSSVS